MKTNKGPFNYTIGTGAIIFSENSDAIMLIEEHKAPGRWGIVGGKLEPMPSLQNVVKEIAEETGYDTRIDGLVRIYQRYDQNPQRISFIYRATALRQAAEPDEDEVISLKWFKLDEIPWDRLRFDDNRIMIEDAIRTSHLSPSSVIRSLPGDRTGETIDYSS